MSDNTSAQTPSPSPKATSIGVNENIAGALAYFLGVFTGVLFFLLEKENKFVKFHAIQSILFSIGLFIIWLPLNILTLIMPDFISVLLTCASLIMSFGVLFVWIFLMYKAYTGEMYKLPVVGDIAYKEAMK